MLSRFVFVFSLIFSLTACFSDKSADLDALYSDGDSEMKKLLDGVDHIEFLYNSQRGNTSVESIGRVLKILENQTSPYPAQLVLIRLNSGRKLIIKHNTDLAKPLPLLKKGEALQFKGLYKWNSRGGMILSTHQNKDFPKRSGWLKYNDIIYD